MIRAMAADWLYHGDCAEILKTFPDCGVDAIVTDPPYGLRFMGKHWDYDIPAVAVWREALRVLKPGGHLLSFGGVRTYHRMVCAIEDAGFEIRDQVQWIFGSGFPKNLDVSKAIDKSRRRDYVLTAVELGLSIPGNNLHDWTKGEHSPGDQWWSEFKKHLSEDQWDAIERRVIDTDDKGRAIWGSCDGEYDITAPATDAARQWQGFGTALKPAHEPICLARKPLGGTVAANVLKWGVGALNIDGCRIKGFEDTARPQGKDIKGGKWSGDDGRSELVTGGGVGRWPTNLVHDGGDEVLALFPQTPGQLADASQNSEACKTQNVYGVMRRGRAGEPRAIDPPTLLKAMTPPR
jgi:site-specific DNA-methyltransferase (adenine-specific)